MESVAGKLLIASPVLTDWFHRAVVLVIEHTAEGAMGIVLGNRSEATVGEVVPALADVAGGEEPVFLGGPVSPESVIAVGDFKEPAQAARIVVGEAGLIDPDGAPPRLRRARIFAGYAGWGAGQLDAEIEAEAWVVADARGGDPFLDGDAWSRVLARMGGAYALLARMPADPRLN